MKKSLVLFVFSALCFAANEKAEVKVPKVSCDLTWDLRDESGASIDIKGAKILNVQVGKKGERELKNFKLEAEITEFKAAGSGPTEVLGYDLALDLTKGESTALTSQRLVEGANLVSLTLIVEDQRAVVNCSSSR